MSLVSEGISSIMNLSGLAQAANVAGTGFQAISSIQEYRERKRADREAKRAAEKEASILEQDTKEAARKEFLESERVRKLQRVLYLKSGVDLEGSPLLVMEETRARGLENIRNITESGAARADLLRRQGRVSRASLTGAISKAGGSLVRGYTNYQAIKKQLS